MNSGATTVDEYIASLPAWQQDNLSVFRTVIHDVLPTVAEAIKWGVPTFLDGTVIVFAMSAFKAHTKYNFIHNGANLKDSDHLFNNGLESKTARAIDLKEGESVDPAQLAQLVQAAVSAIS